MGILSQKFLTSESLLVNSDDVCKVSFSIAADTLIAPYSDLISVVECILAFPQPFCAFYANFYTQVLCPYLYCVYLDAYKVCVAR